jgi:superfamily II DNA or RNA helicase
MILLSEMIIRVDHKLRIALSELPHDVRNQITEALSIPNVARQKAMEQNLWGWQQMPKTIPLYEEDRAANDLLMPRGFGFDLIEGLTDLGIEFEVRDRRTHDPLPAKGQEIRLRPWQEKALSALLDAQEGIWKAPAGSGKTVGVLEAIRRVSGRSIVIVNTKDILWQWQERAVQFLGSTYPVGQIGDNVFYISPYMTIATAQTLHRRFEALEQDGFFDLFTFMCLDECHHATAETYNRVVNRFSARFRIGVSATPDKTGDFALATNVLGPIIHETRPQDVTSLMKPEVLKIPTTFEFGYKRASGRIPSNYSKMLTALVKDHDRNNLIARLIKSQDGSHSLVVSKRLEHLDILAEKVSRLGYQGRILRLTGSESSEERQSVIETATTEPSVIFSTLADEALDIPRLDRLFLVFPQRNPGLITQQVGRVERQHPDKRDAKIFDFCDLRVGPCEAQWRVRRLEVYEPRGYQITMLRIGQ